MSIDLEKAYDRISWDFVRDTLHDVGFDETWIINLMTCIETPKMVVNWNGEKLEAFTPSCGIRQWDSISPYIFVLYIERLS